MESVQQPLDSHSRDGTTEAKQIPGKLGVPRLEVCVGGGGCVSAQLCIRITCKLFRMLGAETTAEGLGLL